MIQPERWNQIERLYHATLELEKPLRPEFLAKACAGDAELLREVESLLDLETRADDFLEERALDLAARAFADEGMPAGESLTGRMVSHYQILEKIGEGGMGVVYKARDTHLARFVAVKVLPPDSVRDHERRRRFVQEAKAASALNHPNIVTIHDIDSVDGVDFIAMEYIAGRPLDQVIGREGLPLKDALCYSVQVADSLAMAHAAGIIHRDVKPANIMVTEEGTPSCWISGWRSSTNLLRARHLQPRLSRRSAKRARSRAPWHTCRRSRQKASHWMPARISSHSGWCCTKRSPASGRSQATPDCRCWRRSWGRRPRL
jgi:serine/threonine protein kinase